MKTLSFLSLLFLSSCISYYQVYEVKCDECREIDKHYASISDSVFVTYYFWAEGGVMAFRVTNNTNQSLYIDWKRSGFSINERLYQYWNDQAFTVTNGQNITYRLPSGMTSNTFYVGNSSSSTSISKPERVSFVVKKSNYYPPAVFSITNPKYINMLASNKAKIIKEKSIGKDAVVYEITDSTELAPFKFRNYITYSVNEDGSQEHTIDNSFYIERITEMTEKHFEYKNLNHMPTMFYKFIGKPGYSIQDQLDNRGIYE